MDMDARWMRDETPTEPYAVIEIDPDARRALRRALDLSCELMSVYWEEPVVRRASDVSPYGMWIDTHFPLHRGAELVVAFALPRSDDQLVALARVCRSSVDAPRVGMGLEFVEMSDAERVFLARSLRGIPPRLVRKAA